MQRKKRWVSDLSYTGVVLERDIRALAHKLFIPPPSPSSSQYQPASFDLTAGAIITPEKIITPRSDKQEYRLRPGELAVVLTAEVLHLPLDFIGTAFAINSISQRGLLVLNAGHVDPGYYGVLAVKILNLQRTSFVLRIGEPIFTIIFERLAKPAREWDGPHLDLMERLEVMERAVESAAPAALLDIHGDGLRALMERTLGERLNLNRETSVKLAREYDEALEDKVYEELENIKKHLEKVESDAVKRDEIVRVFMRRAWYWLVFIVAGLVSLASGILTLLHLWNTILGK